MPRSTARPGRPQRLLVVAPNWLGDLVMATVALSRLAASPARRAGGLEIVLAVRDGWRPLVEGDPRCDRVLGHGRGGVWAGPAGAWRLARDWRALAPHAVVLMPPSVRMAAAAALAGIPRRVGHAGHGRGWLLAPAVPRARRGERHYADEMLDLAAAAERALGLPPPASFAEAPALPAAQRLAVDARLAAGPPAWALAVTATYGDAKAWPAERAAEFVDRVVDEEGARVILLGDAAARAAAGAVRAASRAGWRDDPAGGPGAVDLTGRTTLGEAVAVLRGCAVFVGIDSGLMHLAAALGLPTLGLFGSTSPAWTAPRGARAQTLAVAGFPCSPCYLRRCPQPVYCLGTLDAEPVLARARALARAGKERA